MPRRKTLRKPMVAGGRAWCHQNLALDVQAFGLAAQHFRLPLPSVKQVRLAAASRSDGILVAAVAYGEAAYQSPPTHMRFYGIDTR